MREAKGLKFKVSTKVVLLFLKLAKIFRRTQPFDIAESRAMRLKKIRRLCEDPCEGVAVETVAWGSHLAHKYTPAVLRDESYTLLYFHGGAYIASGIGVYCGFVTRLARELGFVTYNYNYPLAPANPYPAAVDAVADFYKKLIKAGRDPKKIIVAGDSAGGGLALALAGRLRKKKLPLPCAFALFSPWTDLTLSGASVRANRKRDLLLTRSMLQDAVACYVGQNDVLNPEITTALADYRNFPPVYILAADNELLLTDAENLHNALEDSGADVFLSVWEGAQHAFIVANALVRETDAVMAEIKKFIYDRLFKAESANNA